MLEIGSWLGRSTIAMARAAQSVVSVDTHVGPPVRSEGPTLNDLVTNLHRFGVAERVVVIAADFAQACQILRPGVFNMAFVDGAHDGISVLRDGRWASLLLRVGSPILFHDYEVAVGVTSAVHQLSKRWEQVPKQIEGTSLALLWKR